MLKSILVASALAISALMVPTGPATAVPPVSKIETPDAKVEVGRRDNRRLNRDRRRRGWQRRQGFRLYFGPRYRYYGRRCTWLRHRARVTGSRYWWRRYRRCRGW